MPNQIQKSFHERIAKIRLTRSKFIKTAPSQAESSPTNKLSLPGPINTTVTDGVFENFRSLYQTEYESRIAEKGETNSILLESPRLEFPPPENLCRSDRFFISCGSSTSLITDEVLSSSSLSSSAVKTSTAASDEIPPQIPAVQITIDGDGENDGDDDSSTADDYLAFVTYSTDPYGDFRRSMQEMVEARLENGRVLDWNFLEELLVCYLNHNHKKSYGCILRAFVDLVVDLRRNAGEIPVDL